jgi:protein with PEP-CTERM/exosortase system signal
VGWSLPVLQLDIQGGAFVGGSDETTYANSDHFELYALLTPKKAASLSAQYFISAAIVPNPGQFVPADFGSFTINGITFSSSSGMQFGNPPVDALSADLPGHGIFNTWYGEVGFTFSAANRLTQYNVQDDPYDPESRFSPSGTTYYQAFTIDVSNLSPDYSVHFDLYDPGTPIVKAPFSHDAQSGFGGGGGRSVPDGGGTFALLGAGLTGLVGFSRKFVKK